MRNDDALMLNASIEWFSESSFDAQAVQVEHTLVLYVVSYRNADPLKQLVFRILTSIPHEA